MKFILTAPRLLNILAICSLAVLIFKILVLNNIGELFYGAHDLGVIIEGKEQWESFGDLAGETPLFIHQLIQYWVSYSENKLFMLALKYESQGSEYREYPDTNVQKVFVVEYKESDLAQVLKNVEIRVLTHTRQINLTRSSGACFVLKKPSTKQSTLLGSGYLQRYVSVDKSTSKVKVLMKRNKILI